MVEIQSLNMRYVSFKRLKESIELCRSRINLGMKDSSQSSVVRLKDSLQAMEKMFKSVNRSIFPYIDEAYQLGRSYSNCIDAIEALKKNMLYSAEIWDNNSRQEITDYSKSLIFQQDATEKLKRDFLQKHKELNLETLDDITNLLLHCSDPALESINNETEELLSEAKYIISKQIKTVLSNEDELTDQNTLPEEIVIGRYPVKKQYLSILIDIDKDDAFQNVTLNMRKNGNTIVNVGFEDKSSELIDDFVISYIFRYIESYPLGSVNVHIFDSNANYLFKRLHNVFQSGNASDVAKKVIQLHTSINDITNFQEIICEDIFKKTSIDCPDLYSLYETDQSDVFNLVVLRSGLLDNNGFSSSEALNAISSLSKPNDIGHKCGIRFLIIDDSLSFDKNLNASVKHTIESIYSNCEIKFAYKDNTFVYNEQSIEVLRVEGNLDSFIQERSRIVEQAISGKEKAYVAIRDVFSESEEEIGSVLSIPIGKSGNETVLLPLSCKDDSGTVAGQCIGYMAIGQSGSGKSSFFHSLVLNGSWKYSPKDLQFWLLDFKYGGASSKYSNSGLPHVKIIAENNKVDDALCLFQMVFEEMDRRNKAFNQYFVDNIVDYNRIALSKEGMEYFPRIIIAIDEIQEIFRDENASVIQRLISSISVRMRSAGMHFVMVAQNLTEGKSYMLKEAFLPSASGRICFRVAPNIPKDSGYDDDFAKRKQEISELKTGEAYISYGKDTIRKVKMAYASPEDMNLEYFEKIREKYKNIVQSKPLVIGSKQRLSISTQVQKAEELYYDTIHSLVPVNGVYSAVIGEDAYRMSPLTIRFSQHENSAVLILGNDKQIASSLCMSIALSLMRQDAKISIFNADRTAIRLNYDTVPHSFLYLCHVLPPENTIVHDYKLSELEEIIKRIYSTYLKRQKQVQESEDDIPDFDPEFIIINDLFGIDSFTKNILISDEKDKIDNSKVSAPDFNFLAARLSGSNNTHNGSFQENIQTIFSNLLKDGFRYNIHIIVGIKGDPSIWRNARITSDVNNIIVFNSTQYADQFENSYFLKEMLRNISNENGNETMAIWAGRKTYSKLRPIIYDMSFEQEKEYIDLLIEGKNR